MVTRKNLAAGDKCKELSLQPHSSKDWSGAYKMAALIKMFWWLLVSEVGLI